MVVLSAAVTTRTGKILVARQFVEVSRSRIEGLLAAFPKLIGQGKQHTFIETENVRYVYQPLEELFMVLITTKTSNILEDLDTLHLFSRIIPDYCRSTEEEEILSQKFQLIFAFDEVVSLGYRENVVGSQVKTFTEMESHEEKVQEMIARNKEIEAKEQAKLRIKQMEQQKKEAKKRGLSGGPGMGGMGGMGGGMGSMGGGMGGMGGGMSPSISSSERMPFESERPSYSSPAPSNPPPSAGKGMQLGKKKDTNTFLAAMKSEEGLEDLDIGNMSLTPNAPGPQAGTRAAAPPAPSEGIQVIIEEKIVVVANRDGGLQNLEIKGDMIVRVTDPAKASLRVVLNPPQDKTIQFKSHPNVDKKLWTTDNIIGLKDPSRPFPVGQPVGVLKWRVQSRDESLLPLNINCWPSPVGDGSCDVNIEYELEKQIELHNVLISIPIPPSGKPPVVSSVDGEYRFNKSQGTMEWMVPLIDSSNNSGTLEFNCGGDDASQFFPVHVAFSSSHPLCEITVSEVQNIEGASVTFASSFSSSTEEYTIV